MGELLFFVLGLMIGGMVGVTVMCCFIINKMNEPDYQMKKLAGERIENKKY